MRAANCPCSPPSNNTATTIWGFLRGVTPTNQALSLYFDLPLAVLALSALLTVCALPVLPAKSIPCRCALPAVPIGVGTFDMASVMISQFAGSIGIFTWLGVSVAGMILAGNSAGLVTWGRTSRPPLEIAPIA